jgi:multimeric flavodoxin WrbA
MEKVKILGICGSPRHSNSEIMTKEALKAAESMGNVETKFLSVADKEINGCISCFRCYYEAVPEKMCPQFDDDAQYFLEAMAWCDGMLIASPVYWGGISAQLKVLLDRTMVFDHYAHTPYKSGLGNKTIGALAIGFDPHGGQEFTINQIHIWAQVQDMIVVASGPSRISGCYFGGACAQFPMMGYKNELKAVQTRPDGLGMKSCTSTAKKLVHTTRLIKVGRKQLGHTDYYEQFTEDLKEA